MTCGAGLEKEAELARAQAMETVRLAHQAHKDEVAALTARLQVRRDVCAMARGSRWTRWAGRRLRAPTTQGWASSEWAAGFSALCGSGGLGGGEGRGGGEAAVGRKGGGVWRSAWTVVGCV